MKKSVLILSLIMIMAFPLNAFAQRSGNAFRDSIIAALFFNLLYNENGNSDKVREELSFQIQGTTNGAHIGYHMTDIFFFGVAYTPPIEDEGLGSGIRSETGYADLPSAKNYRYEIGETIHAEVRISLIPVSGLYASFGFYKDEGEKQFLTYEQIPGDVFGLGTTDLDITIERDPLQTVTGTVGFNWIFDFGLSWGFQLVNLSEEYGGKQGAKTTVVATDSSGQKSSLENQTDKFYIRKTKTYGELFLGWNF